MAEWSAVDTVGSWELTAGQGHVSDKGCVFSMNDQGIYQIEMILNVKLSCIMNKQGQHETYASVRNVVTNQECERHIKSSHECSRTV